MEEVIMSKLQPYTEAEKLTREIDKLLVKYPLTESTARDWHTLARIVQTTSQIIADYAIKLQLNKGGDLDEAGN
jgi:hypothetical protein